MKLIWAYDSIILIPFGAFLYWQIQRRGKKRGFSPDFSKFLKTKKYDAAFYSKILRFGFCCAGALSAIYFILMIYCIIDVINLSLKILT